MFVPPRCIDWLFNRIKSKLNRNYDAQKMNLAAPVTLIFLQMVWKSPMTHDEAPRSSTVSDLSSLLRDSRTWRPEQLVTLPSGRRRGSFQTVTSFIMERDQGRSRLGVAGSDTWATRRIDWSSRDCRTWRWSGPTTARPCNHLCVHVVIYQ